MANTLTNEVAAQCLASQLAHPVRTEGRRRAYQSWNNMLRRCFNPKCESWKDYGQRGITVCGQWLDFANFHADMGDMPDGLTIDRIDNNGNYEPGNCRWATRATQVMNRRKSVLVTARGKTLSIKEWSKRTGVPGQTIYARIRSGWPPSIALRRTLPERKPSRRRGRPAYPHFRADFQPRAKRQYTKRPKV